jgi:hypothetical protein
VSAVSSLAKESFPTLTIIVSPVIAVGFVNIENGTYLGCQLFAGFMFMGSALFVWLLRCMRCLEFDRATDGEELNISKPMKASFLEKAFFHKLLDVTTKA